MTIVSRIEQGIHAWIEKSEKFDVYSQIDVQKMEYHQEMDVKALSKDAMKGGILPI